VASSRNRETNKLGEILKRARIGKDYSRDQLAGRAGISTRYLTAIENENRKPKFDVLYRLIRSLGISADCIFYPETAETENDCTQLVRLIQQCDMRDRRLVAALVDQMLDAEASDSI